MRLCLAHSGCAEYYFFHPPRDRIKGPHCGEGVLRFWVRGSVEERGEIWSDSEGEPYGPALNAPCVGELKEEEEEEDL
jgi:hypothetical protein